MARLSRIAGHDLKRELGSLFFAFEVCARLAGRDATVGGPHPARPRTVPLTKRSSLSWTRLASVSIPIQARVRFALYGLAESPAHPSRLKPVLSTSVWRHCTFTCGPFIPSIENTRHKRAVSPLKAWYCLLFPCRLNAKEKSATHSYNSSVCLSCL
jgi:hypothetical protein